MKVIKKLLFFSSFFLFISETFIIFVLSLIKINIIMKLERQIEIFEEVKILLEDNSFQHGICEVMIFLEQNDVISIKETVKIRYIMETHKPTIINDYKEFTDSDLWTGDVNNKHHPLLGFWWKPICVNPETRQIRIDYIAKLLSNLK